MAALVAIPSPGLACPFSEAMTPFLFESLPAAPAEGVAARVEILPRQPRGSSARAHSIARARIVEMIRGDYAGSILLLETNFYDKL